MNDNATGWTIGRRVTSGFAVGVALLIVAASIGVWALSRAVNAYEEALATQRTMLIPTLRTQSEVRGANVEALRFLLTSDERYVRKADSLIASARDLVAEVRGASLDTGEVARAWLPVSGLLDEWTRAQGDVIAAHRRGDQAAALSVRESRLEPLRTRLDSAIRLTATTLQTNSDKVALDSRSGASTARLALLFGTLLAILASIASAVLLRRSINRPLRESANVIASSAAEILAATTEQAAGINESMAAVTETVATVDEVAQTAAQAAQRAKALADSAQRSADTGASGRVAVQRSITAIRAVESEVDTIAKGIVLLAEQASAIGEITSAVSDIAEQTRLLALNAAVEAARAGENGRGFAVVAAEIKALAGQAKDSTTQVARILNEIQRATSSAVMATEQGTKQTAAASRQAVEAGEIIAQLADVAAEASQTAAQIAASAGQQALGMEQIRQAIANIHDATQQHLTATRQSESAAENLTSLGSRLVSLIGNA
ncbi:MAG TPA: methyl-accepting chemotaxis protein [Gemmatimonadaceae bacterium]|nr:methyl-accepting chemotaxis protein [Gemmatimonadaceae bacterium]